MRTQDWTAGNAPAGPALRLRCQCGGDLGRLPGTATVGRARGAGTNDATLCCGTCGRSVRLEVRHGPADR